MYADPSGTFLATIIGAAVGGLFNAALAICEGKSAKEIWASAVNGIISGAVTGLATDLMLCSGGSAALVLGMYVGFGALGSFTGSLAESAINGKDMSSRDVWIDAAIEGLWGAAFGALDGAIEGKVVGLMDDFMAHTGKKTLAKGVTFAKAAWWGLKREFKKFMSSTVEEAISSIMDWYTRECIEGMFGG